jgi:hypothetical protein
MSGVLAMLSGCTISRQDRVERQASDVGDQIDDQRDETLKLSLKNEERTARLNYLKSLRATWGDANRALAAIPSTVPPEEQNNAYDLMGEVYETIEWNIPLGPGEAMRPLPAGFSGNVLQLGAIRDWQNRNLPPRD